MNSSGSECLGECVGDDVGVGVEGGGGDVGVVVGEFFCWGEGACAVDVGEAGHAWTHG